MGTINIDYTEGSKKTDSGEFGHGARKGLQLTDAVMAHEIGHLVDLGPGGGKYSINDKEFLAFSGWQRHDGSNSDEILNIMEQNCDEPFPQTFDNDMQKNLIRRAAKRNIVEKKVGKEDLQKVIDEEVKRTLNTKMLFDELRKKLNPMIKPEDDQNDSSILQKDQDAKQKKREIARYSANLANAKLFKRSHEAIGASTPWYSHHHNYTDAKRIIHESYGEWFSYNASARTDGTKISDYQFRAPCEEFAELYATYHIAKDKGSTIDPARKSWFEKKGLHNK